MSYLWCGSSVWRLIRHRPAWTRGVWIHFVVIHLFLLFLVLVFSTTDGFCDQLSPPVNGTLDTTFTRFGTTVTFGCFPGFELEGAKKTQCVRSETHTSGFKWDSVPPLCTGNTLSVFVLLLYARALYITLRRFHSAIAYANRNCTGDRLMYPSNFIQRTRCSYIIKLVSRYNVTLFMARQRLKSLMLFYVIHLTSRVQLTLNIIVTVRHSFSPVLSAVQFVSFTVISNRMKDYFNTSSYYRVYAFLKGPFVNELKQKQNIIIFVKLVVLKWHQCIGYGVNL